MHRLSLIYRTIMYRKPQRTTKEKCGGGRHRAFRGVQSYDANCRARHATRLHEPRSPSSPYTWLT